MSEIVNFKSKVNEKSAEIESTESQFDPRQYSPDEVSDIIRQALQNVDGDANDSVIHSELLSIGQDFGLGKDDIERAYEALLDERDMARMKEHLWLRFKVVSATVSLIAVVLFVVDIFLVPDSSFVLYAVPVLALVIIFCGLQIRYIPKLVTSVFDFSSNVETGSAPSFTTRNIHVSVDSVLFYSGFFIEKGVIRIEKDCLLIEYRKVDSLFGVLKSKVKEVRIPLSEITNVKLERKFWLSKLTLRAKSLKTFEDVPGESDGYLKLTFTPRARVAVFNLVKDIEQHIAN